VTRWLKRGLLGLLVVLLLAAAGAWWFVHQRQPQRSGERRLTGLSAPVNVRYDEVGVPHLLAANEADLYRALGYVHAQDRLFQMEMLRRLARGELAEVLGPKLLPSDRLFRTLGIRAHADATPFDPKLPGNQALLAYLDGINQFQDSHPAPLEFAVLGIPKRPFTPADTLSTAGYLAYSFAAAFKTEPVMTQIRDQLGAAYLKDFDIDWHPEGPFGPPGQALGAADLAGLQAFAALSAQAVSAAGLPQMEGSNAWAISGRRTASGKPLLAGDPHISFAAPAVWYEAHLQSPGFELYGHFQALNPAALLGHNSRFGWSLTMFQNDDIDLVAETTDAAHPDQVLIQGRWQPLSSRQEVIRVKGAEPVTLTLQRSPHGPIINEALGEAAGPRPIALWWAYLETENPALEAFYQLNRADTLDKARTAVAGIHAPGLNVVYANAAGDIGWWAAAKLPLRPPGVNPMFVLDGQSAEADKLGFLPFSRNPQEENPARGYIVSANHQPSSTEPVPGYYNLWDRAARLQQRLDDPRQRWTPDSTRALQLDVQTGYFRRVLTPLLPVLQRAATTPDDQALLKTLASWNGDHDPAQVAPTLFNQFLHDLAHEALADELGEAAFSNLRRTRALDHLLPRLAASADSPWWDRRNTPDRRETRDDTVRAAWQASLAHLRATFGPDSSQWTWGRAHTLTHGHPLGLQKPLDKLFNVGPFPAPGGRETPNNLSGPMGPAPWAVNYGPSTRRIIDFAHPESALGINPVGQSGVWGDAHYRDQAEAHVRGDYRQEHLAEADVAAHTASRLQLLPR
jgi:penicillin amidase